MRKFMISLVLVSSVAFADTFICDTKGYTTIEHTDSFGNKNKEYVTNLKVRVLEFVKKKKYEDIEKFFAENIYLNTNGYHGFKKLITDKIDRAVFFNTSLPVSIQAFISAGRLPTSIEINTLNIATVKNKIKVNVNIYNIAGSLASYLLNPSLNTLRDRLLLFTAFLTIKNQISVPFKCKNNLYSNFAENYITDILLPNFIKLIQKKDPLALKIAFLLLNQKYNDIDNLLLTNENIKKLFLIGKEHYFSFAKAHKECDLSRNYYFKVSYICFSGKEQAIEMFEKMIKSKKTNNFNKFKTLSIGDENWGYLMKNYCRLKRGEILPRIFEENNKYCIFKYISKNNN